MMNAIKILAAILGSIVLYMCLWPVPISPVAWNAPVDRGLVDPIGANDRLEIVKHLSLGDHQGPEDVVIGFDGLLYTGTKDGRIISFNADGSDVKEFANVGGRPLGLEFVGGFIYVANAYLGLQRVRADGTVVVLSDEFDGIPIGYADDVAVAKDGSVYFSDATTKFPASEWQGTYNASLLDIMEHGGHGRILKYDSFSDLTTLIIDGLNFANGVAISDDQQYLLIAETGSYQVLRYWLDGPNAGKREVIINNLPGFPDNINNGLNGRFWVGLISPRSALLDQYSDDPFARKMMQRMPAALRPKAVASSHLIGIDGNGEVLMNLHDTQARFPNITGAIENREAIYISSLFGNSIGLLAKQDLQ